MKYRESNSLEPEDIPSTLPDRNWRHEVTKACMKILTLTPDALKLSGRGIGRTTSGCRWIALASVEPVPRTDEVILPIAVNLPREKAAKLLWRQSSDN